MAPAVKKSPESGVDKSLITVLVRSLNSVVESNQQMARVVAGVAIILVLGILTLEYFRRWWKDDFELHFPIGSAAVVLHSSANSSDFKSAVFIVPASKCWVNTGLEINRYERITIRASGQVNLAVNLIEQEKIGALPWSEPEGSSFVKLDSIDRSDFLIHKHIDRDQLQIGNLVGYFLPVDENQTDNEPSLKNPRPKAYGGAFYIGNKLESKLNNTGKTVNLWLCVNDIVLDNSLKAKEAYLGDSAKFINNFLNHAEMEDDIDSTERENKILEAKKKWLNRTNEWPKIVKKEAWDLYFYDNIGHYLVTVEKQ